jgi:hypothetical protein
VSGYHSLYVSFLIDKMISSPGQDNSCCLLIDWDNSSGTTVFDPSIHERQFEGQDDEGLEVGSVGNGIIHRAHTVKTITAQESVKDLATRTV